jgi:hypothetical protein
MHLYTEHGATVGTDSRIILIMKKWYILNRYGSPMEEKELPRRPSEASPEDREPFRPWHKQDEHVHIEDGRIYGIHAYGELEELQNILKVIIQKEEEILNKFDNKGDIFLGDAKDFLKL